MASDGTKQPKPPGRSSGRGLGRGLGALIANTQSAPQETDEFTAQTPGDRDRARDADSRARALERSPGSDPGARLVSIEHISPNPQQPRTQFDPDALQELAESIRAHGIIQPLIVTQTPDEPSRYWLVAGERRWRAAQLAELTEVPVTVRETSPQQRLEWALVENIQRADLNALEEAAAYQTLVDEFGLTQAEIGKRVGKSRSAVANTLRLLQLPRPAQEALLDNTLSPGHARALLALEDHDLILEALEAVLARNLSVRQTEELVRRLLTQPPPQSEPEPEDQSIQDHLTYLENRFRNALGTRVNLNRNRDGSGRLVVHFYNDDDLAGIYQLLAGDDDGL